MTTFPEHELIAHAQALRSLARALVGAQDADDLVQDAALQALMRPSRIAGGWLGWLQAVLRHRASKHWRGEKRRKRREALAMPREPGDAPLRIAAQREVVASLDAALLALPEPYQGTLLLRYFDDLTPTEIAASAGVPLPTVKSRLQRGLAMLRERLDANGDGKDWRGGLVAAWGIGRAAPVPAVVAVSAGVLLMGMTTKLVLGAAAIAIAAVFLWPTDPVPQPAPVAASGVVPGAAANSKLEAAPERIAVAATPSVLAENKNDGVDDARATFQGRCVDESGMPLASVDVLARTRKVNGGDVLASDSQVTASDGTFAVRLAQTVGAYHVLELRLEARCPAEGSFFSVQVGQRIELGDVVLPLAFSVRGRVVDKEGVPQAGVELAMNYEVNQGNTNLVDAKPHLSGTTSAADGSFSSRRDLPPGRYWYQVKNRRLVQGGNVGFQLGDGPREHLLEIVVEPAPPKVRGVVVGEDGLPIPSAGIRLDDSFTSSDGEGRFEIGPDPNRVVTQRSLSASADGYEGTQLSWSVAETIGELRVVLRRAPTLTVRVVDARDLRPVTRFGVRVLVPNTWGDAASIAATEHADGVASTNVAAGRYFVFVTPGDAQFCASPFTAVGLESGRATEVTIVLAPIQERRLIVQDGHGPVADVRVELLDPADVHLLCNTEAFVLDAPWQVHGLPKVQQLQVGRTDAAGVLQLRGPKAPLALRLAGGGLALQIVQPVRLDEAGDLVVTAQRGAVWRGRLVPESVARDLFAIGTPRPNTQAPKIGLELARLDGESLLRYLEPPFPFGADGSFQIEGIPAGTWHAIVKAKSSFAAATITVTEGQQLEQDVDVSAMAIADVTLHVMIDGVPATEAHVNVMGRHAMDTFGRRFASQTLGRADQQGMFSLKTFVGDLECHITSHQKDTPAWHLRESVSILAPGSQEIVLDVRLGGLDVQVLQPDGGVAASVELRAELRTAGTIAPWLFTADGDGKVKVSPCSAGTYLFRARPRCLMSRAAQDEFARANGWEALQNAWIEVGSVTVTPGAALPRQLQLPEAWRQ